MNIIVNRGALEDAISKLISEDRSIRSVRIDQIAGKQEVDLEDPIKPIPQMANQLTVAEPPVADPEYMPATVQELSIASSLIAAEVPEKQIEFYYRKLHDLLDSALDKESPDGRDFNISPTSMNEGDLAKVIDLMLEQDDESENYQDSNSSDIDEAVRKIYSITSKFLQKISRDIAREHGKATYAPGASEDVDKPIVKKWAITGLNNDNHFGMEVITKKSFTLDKMKKIIPKVMKIKYLDDESYKSMIDKVSNDQKISHDKLIYIIGERIAELYDKDIKDSRLGGKPLGDEEALEKIADMMFSSVISKPPYGNDYTGDPELDPSSVPGKGFSNKRLFYLNVQNSESLKDNIEKNMLSLKRKPVGVKIKKEKDQYEVSAKGSTYSFPISQFETAISAKVQTEFDQSDIEKKKSADSKEDTEVNRLSKREEEKLQRQKEKEKNAEDKESFEKLASELGTTYGALKNIDQDLAVALGDRMQITKKRVPGAQSDDKVDLYSRISKATANKFRKEIGNVIVTDWLEKNNLGDAKLSKADRDEINSAMMSIADGLIGYDSSKEMFLKFNPVFRSFQDDVVKIIDSLPSGDQSSPDYSPGYLFDEFPDYFDAKQGDLEWQGRGDFTDKDTRETMSRAKNLAYFVRNVFNVGYELEARSKIHFRKARELADKGYKEKSAEIQRQAKREYKLGKEYKQEGERYKEENQEIVAAFENIEIPESLIRKHILPFKEEYLKYNK